LFFASTNPIHYGYNVNIRCRREQPVSCPPFRGEPNMLGLGIAAVVVVTAIAADREAMVY
jgi:hypothetical protein